MNIFAALFIVSSIIPVLYSCPTAKEQEYGTTYGGRRYLISTAAESWFRANILCKSIGMELISINSDAENDLLANYLQLYSATSSSGNGYWTAGARHGAGTNDFVWWTTGKPVAYRKFAEKQPDNSGNKEYCIEAYLRNNAVLWNDYVCDQKQRFICQS